jgi:hypothetical protein
METSAKARIQLQHGWHAMSRNISNNGDISKNKDTIWTDPQRQRTERLAPKLKSLEKNEK